MDSLILELIKKQVEDSLKVKNSILQNEEILQLVLTISKKTIDAYKSGNKTILAGNGGSAADAQHFAGEFVSRFYFDRPGLPSIALSTDTSVITAVGNDYGYEKVFSRQIQANGNSGDIFIAISTSGNSENILEALKESKKRGIITVGLTGEDGGKMKELCDYCVCVPSKETPRIQEAHILIEHIICSLVEEEIFGNEFK